MALTSALRSFDRDKDALAILPLSMIPLRSRALRDARLVKNARLEGVVEIFSDPSSGSGQVSPEDLAQVFDLSGDRGKDLEVVKALSVLSSYDVYSLRIDLKDLGIEVDDPDSLNLSGDLQQELSPYLQPFTRPLIAAIYGDQNSESVTWADIGRLFDGPEVETVQGNLHKLPETLGIDISHMPRFLEKYGELYLSLAYYQYVVDLNAPGMSAFRESIAAIRMDRQFQSNRPFQRTCNFVEKRLILLHQAVGDLLETFCNRTEEMWRNPSLARFREMEEQVIGHRLRIGGALCAIDVKLNAWDSRFPKGKAATPSQQAEFLVGVMQQGLNGVDSPDSGSMRGNASA